MRHNPHSTLVEAPLAPGQKVEQQPTAETEVVSAGRPVGEPGIDEDEEIIQQCIMVVAKEQKGSVSLLQRRLRLGYTRAARIMDELENRGIVGPSKPNMEPRDVLVDENSDLVKNLSAKPEAGGASAEPVSTELVTTPRAAFLAANPRAAELQEAFEKAFRERFAGFCDGFKSLLHQFVDKAEQARQLGILLNEFVDTLPGKKLTLDFYQQHAAMFTDGRGQSIPFQMLEWFMKVARHMEGRAITDMESALKWQQPFLKAPEEELFSLVSDRPPGVRIPPKDEWAKISDWFENPEVEENWEKLRENPNYFVGGHLRQDLVETMREEWGPKFKVIDELRKELGI